MRKPALKARRKPSETIPAPAPADVSRIPERLRNHTPIIVSSDQRFLVFGYTLDELDKKPLRMFHTRLILWWSSDVRGLWGLAASGPSDGCRVTVPAVYTIIHDPQLVVECSTAAAAAFERGPWGSDE